MQVLLRGGTLVGEEGSFQADLLIVDEKIEQIAEKIPVNQLEVDCQVLDLHGMMVMPGVIDAHTHYQLKSRNTVTADDFVSGSIAAASGGVTTFIDYADQLPDTTLGAGAQARIQEALGKTVLDFTLHQTITHFDDKVSQELAELLKMGISSIKMFTTYRREGYMILEEKWEQLFKRLQEVGLLLTVHAEDDALIMELEAEYQWAGLLSPKMHPKIRPAQAEGVAVARVGELARKVGIPVYIAHLSSAQGLTALQGVKARGGEIYAETTPHYLLLDESCLAEEEAQKFIMTPPLRTQADQDALWLGLEEEEIQVVATDHCAFNLEQKLSDESCLTILPGLPGSETLLPLTHHYGVVERGWDYCKLAKVLSTNPAKIFGLYPNKGSLKPGTDADIVVIDPKRRVTLAKELLHSMAGYTPYEGFSLKGYPVLTILRGKVIVKEGEWVGELGQGRFISAQKSSLIK